LRFRRKSCGRTFNALIKTSMAHLRKKEKWFDRARDDRWQEPGQDRGAVRRSPDNGLSLAASVSPRARLRQAPMPTRRREDRGGGRLFFPRP